MQKQVRFKPEDSRYRSIRASELQFNLISVSCQLCQTFSPDFSIGQQYRGMRTFPSFVDPNGTTEKVSVWNHSDNADSIAGNFHVEQGFSISRMV